MNKEQFAQALDELMGKIEDGPGSHADVLAQIANRRISMKEVQEIVSGINESFATIRLIIKYLVFDLEATRRERDQFRMLLEDKK